MDEYIQLLILMYFQSNEDYSYRDIKKMLGINSIKLNEYLDFMIDNDMLIYNENRMDLKEKGIRILIAANLYNEKSNVDYYNTIFDPKEKWDIYKPYAPDFF